MVWLQAAAVHATLLCALNLRAGACATDNSIGVAGAKALTAAVAKLNLLQTLNLGGMFESCAACHVP